MVAPGGGCMVLFGGACVVLFSRGGGMHGFIQQGGHAWFYSAGGGGRAFLFIPKAGFNTVSICSLPLLITVSCFPVQAATNRSSFYC